MAVPRITVTLSDEGYFKKIVALKPNTNVKKLLDFYRAHLCTRCTNPELLDYWYETTRQLENQTPKILGMRDGDIIDVRVKEHCTRGACPVPPQQTLPNIHYFVDADVPMDSSLQARSEAPEGPDRITFSIRDMNGTQITLRMRRDTKMVQALQAFAHHVQKEVKDCRLCIDGKRIIPDHTPEEVRFQPGRIQRVGVLTLVQLELEEDDQLDVFYELWGGCGIDV
ncbi:hypothetical protein LTR36_004291 [Oleoguttula mirabilis]|uniref:Ubiquitin-like domain-containing protein n=1 Tax=Oleoguttula mirabilis TaxID=1507867 RepID=A0AAV9JGD0_9PEZI|nr:hypothetical protein LTR36_004291 [Oleoguttula mirabilis]